jgi:hypothetical protein
LVHAEENVYTEYPDSRRDEWTTKILPALKNISLSRLIKMTGKSRRMLINARAGHARPHPTNQQILRETLLKFGLI